MPDNSTTRVARSTIAVRRTTRTDVEAVLALRRNLLTTGEAHWARGDAGDWEAIYRTQLEEEIDGIVSTQATFLAVAVAAPVGTARTRSSPTTRPGRCARGRGDRDHRSTPGQSCQSERP